MIEIGVYKPKFYPFICPYKSCWIAGATVETPQNGTTKVTINSEEELERLKREIQSAKENKKGIVEYNNTQLDIEDAMFLAHSQQKLKLRMTMKREMYSLLKKMPKSWDLR